MTTTRFLIESLSKEKNLEYFIDFDVHDQMKKFNLFVDKKYCISKNSSVVKQTIFHLK